MENTKSLQAQVGGYMSKLFRDHFGKGPTSVYVLIEQPFITIHLRGFLAPTEQILMKQNETRRVLETRDLLMDDLKADIKLEFWKLAEFDVQEIYADWDLEKKTGMIIAILDDQKDAPLFSWPEQVDKKSVYEEINKASEKAQKKPDHIAVYWLNKRTILIERAGIFVQIEKELIKGGFTEELKLVKRPLEYQLVYQSKLDALLQSPVQEVFVDWNFDEDKGYMALVLEETRP